MAKIDKSKLSKKITDTYSIEDNTFKLSKIKNAEKDIYKDEPKDEINVEVGDSKTPSAFLPQVKLMRWSNETNFSLRLIDDESGTEKIDSLDDKIVYEKGNKKVEFYEYLNDEGGYKLVWYLKKKPKTNKVEFTIQSKGLDFFYQPELTQEEIDEGAIRPDNVIGSYAVYHSTKGGMVDANGKDYKCGKAFHIYRPHIIDASGAETWGILHIENGIYSVEIPQEFLDSAVYPIKSNDTFGYESIGLTEGILRYSAGAYRKGNLYSLAVGGTLDNIKAVIYHTSTGAGNYSGSVFINQKDSGGANNHGQITTKEQTNNLTTNVDFITFLMSNEALSSGVNYILNFSSDGNSGSLTLGSRTRGDAGPARWNEEYSNYAQTKENPWTTAAPSSAFYLSIYATYTTAGGGGGAMSFTLTGVGHLT